MITRFLFCSFIVSICVNIASSQEQPLPFLRDVSLNCSVYREPSSGIFTYTFAARNGVSSEGKIIAFEIDVSRDSNGVNYGSEGLLFKNTRIAEAYSRLAGDLGDQIVPVSFPSLPLYSDAGITVRKTVNFFGPLIQPGQEVTGFVLASRGIPGIRKFVAMPQFDINDYYPDAQGVVDLDSLTRKISSDREATKFNGVTVGPISPQADFSVVPWIDTLISFVGQSFTAGWIADASVRDKYIGYLTNGKSLVLSGNFTGARTLFQTLLHDVDQDSSSAFASEAYALLRYNAEYLLDFLPATNGVSSYSLFATHSLWLEQNSEVFSGDIGVNDAGSAPFLDSQVELSVGIGTSTASGYSIKGNRIKVKQGSSVGSDVYYNELDNNGMISGTLHTPLTLPLVSTLPEFKQATPGSQNITIPQNGTQTLEPGSYGDIQVRRNGKLTFTGGSYHLASLNTGDNVQLLFKSQSEIRIAGKFDTDQGSYIGPEDTTSLSANQIVFYIGGINGSNGNLGAAPKAAQIGLSNTVKANFYVPNGTLWIRQNSQATGAFIGKDVNVGIGAKVWLKSAF